MQYTFFRDTMYVGIITNNWKLIYTEDTRIYTETIRMHGTQHGRKISENERLKNAFSDRWFSRTHFYLEVCFYDDT